MGWGSSHGASASTGFGSWTSPAFGRRRRSGTSISISSAWTPSSPSPSMRIGRGLRFDPAAVWRPFWMSLWSRRPRTSSRSPGPPTRPLKGSGAGRLAAVWTPTVAASTAVGRRAPSSNHGARSAGTRPATDNHLNRQTGVESHLDSTASFQFVPTSTRQSLLPAHQNASTGRGHCDQKC